MIPAKNIIWSLDTDLLCCLSLDICQKSTKDVTPRHSKMKIPRVHDSLSWGKRGNKKLSAEDSALVSAAMSNLNKFSNDGNFMAEFTGKKEKHGDHNTSSNLEARGESTSADSVSKGNKEDVGTLKPPMGANQLAAKALQLRMKGKHDEAEKLLVMIIIISTIFFFSIALK